VLEPCIWCERPTWARPLPAGPLHISTDLVVCDDCFRDSNGDEAWEQKRLGEREAEQILESATPLRPVDRIASKSSLMWKGTLRWATSRSSSPASDDELAWANEWPLPEGIEARKHWVERNDLATSAIERLPDPWPWVPELSFIGLAITRSLSAAVPGGGSVLLLGPVLEDDANWTFGQPYTFRPPYVGPVPDAKDAADAAWERSREMERWYRQQFQELSLPKRGRPLKRLEAARQFLSSWTGPRNVAALARAMEVAMEDPPTERQLRYLFGNNKLRWPN
jgi:hypothetical protein